MIFLVLAFVLAVGGGLAFGYWIGWRDEYPSKGLGIGVIGITVVCALLLVGITSIPSGPPDGCYQIGSYSGSGTGVGVGPKGQVTVVPIVTSGRTYTPIECPR